MVLLGIVLITNHGPDSKVEEPQGINKKPRLIIVGSSNLYYNFDFKKLSKKFKKYDVVSCGLNASSGLLATIDNLQRINPKKGDLAILCLPHNLYEKGNLLPLSSNQKIGFHKGLVYECFKSFPGEFFNEVASLNVLDAYKLTSTYESRRHHLGTKENVSNISEKYMNCWTSQEDMFAIKSLSTNEGYLLKVRDYLNSNVDAKVLFRFAPLKEGQYEVDSQRLAFLRSNYPFTNTFQSSIFKGKYFFDQWYHLNACGREVNTNQLIQELGVLHENSNLPQ